MACELATSFSCTIHAQISRFNHFTYLELSVTEEVINHTRLRNTHVYPRMRNTAAKYISGTSTLDVHQT